MLFECKKALFWMLFVVLYSLNVVKSASSLGFCDANRYSLPRSSNTVELTIIDNGIVPIFTNTSPTSKAILSTNDLFDGMVYQSAKIGSCKNTDNNVCSVINQPVTCSISSKTITCNPWAVTQFSTDSIIEVRIYVTFTQNFSSKIPQTYQMLNQINLGSTADQQYTCVSTYYIQFSKPTSLKMSLTAATPTVVVESTNAILFKYQPLFDTTANEIQILISKQQYFREFQDQTANLWNILGVAFNPTGANYRSYVDCSSSTISTYYCVSLSLDQFIFLKSTEYSFTITNFNFPFHPLGIDDVQIKVRLNSFDCESGSVSLANILTSALFTPKIVTQTVKALQFCTTSTNCSATGNVAVNYSSVKITIGNPQFLLTNAQLDLIFTMDFFSYKATNTKDVKISFNSGTIYPSTFTYNLPNNNMKASFILASRELITNNDITIEITKPVMGLDSKSYTFQLNAISTGTTNSIVVTATQFQLTSNSIALSPNLFTNLALDTSIAFQIGSSSKYTFKVTPAYPFTTTQMWIRITFPSQFTLAANSGTCYEVTLNGQTQVIPSTSITELIRNLGAVRYLVTFQSSILVTDYTVSTCNVINPIVTGMSGSIKVEANYASDANLTEQGSTTANIQPAQLLDGTTIQPLDTTKLKTMDQNGYIFTLVLPVSQAVGNKVKIWFPSYLTNFNYVSSPTSFSSQSTNKVYPNIYWVGILKNLTPGPITLNFSGFNPPTTQSSYTFLAEIYDSNDNLQLNKQIIYSTAQYTVRNMFFQQVTRDSDNNAAQATYTFKVRLDYFIESDFFMRIGLDNSQVILNLSVIEMSTNLNGITSVQTIDGTNKYIDIKSTINNGFTNSANLISEFTFQVKTITNYRSTQPLQFLLMTGKSAIMQGSQTTYSFTNNYIPFLETAVTLTSIQNKYFGEESMYEFSFRLDIGIPLNGRFDLTMPNNLSTTVSVTSTPSSIFTSQLTNQIIRVTCTVVECKSFTLRILNIKNPTFQSFSTSSYPAITSIQTYDNAVNDYLMQRVDFSQTSINYSNNCYATIPYTSYCKDCTNQNTCTSCYTGAIFNGQSKDKLDTINNVCVNSCPSGSYLSNLQCLKCKNNCLTCLSDISCQTCQPNFVLQGTKCQQTCDPTYFQDSQNICQQCDPNLCLNCTGTKDNCLTCQVGKGLITLLGKGSCVNCSSRDGYYDKLDGSGVCGICNQACVKCSGSPINCSACVDVLNGKSVYLNPTTSRCSTDCYADGYSLILDNNGKQICAKCAQGNQPCNTCQNYADFCLSCSSPFYLQAHKCVTKEEITVGYFGNDASRTADPCLSVCTQCVSQTVCTHCISNFYLAKGTCSSSCPDDLPISDGQGGCKEDLSTKVSNISDDNRVVPFPMLLASIAFCISIYFSKYEYTSTFVPGCVVGFCSLFEWISWIILIATASVNSGMNSAAAVLALLGFLFLYIINITQFILTKKYIENNPPFMEWILTSEKNKLCYRIIKYASLIISFKAQRIIFSKYFNQSFFKAKLENIDIFSSFNKLALVSVFLNSSLVIIASAVVTYTYTKQSQGFFLGLDSLIVTIMMIMFMIWDSLKKKDFFEEPLNIDQTFSQRFFPFDQSYMERIEKKANNSRMSRGESNSSLADFRENKKVTLHENLQKPLTQVLDPNEISPNAQIDPNVLKNSEYGAPYLIQDHIYESYKPGSNGGKRNFEKKHIAPQFDYSKYNPIQENSNEDEDFDDEEHMDLKYRQNQSSFLKQNEKMENAKGFKGRNEQVGGFYGQNGEEQEDEPVPRKPNTRHTVYYNDNVQDMLNSQSTKNGGLNSNLQQQQQAGVSIGVNMNDEEDEDNKELRSRIYSKPSINPDDPNGSAMMRQSYSPQNNFVDNPYGNDSKQSKTEGNSRSPKKNSLNSPSNKSKKGSKSPNRSRSISPSLAKVEDQKSKKKTQSPKRQKSTPSDQENPNMRNSYNSNKSNKSKKNSPKKSGQKTLDDDNMLFYFAHPVEGDSQLPPNQQQRNSQGKQKQGNNNPTSNQVSQDNANNENRVERIMPIEEDLDAPNQKSVQPKYDMANQMKMKGPYSNDKNRVKGLLGLEDQEDSPEGKLSKDIQGKGSNYQGSQDLDRNIYDSSESVRTAEEAEVNYNEVSPSDFNVLNQRYEEDFFAIQMQQQMQRQQQKTGGQNFFQHPDSSVQGGNSIQMGSVIQSPHNQMLGSQQQNSVNQFNQRPPLLLGNSTSNVSVGIPKTTQSVGGKKKSKSKPRSTSKNRTNISAQGHPIQHQGLMTPTSGSTQGMRRNFQGQQNNQHQQEYNNGQSNDPYSRGNNSPMGSYRTGAVDNFMNNNTNGIRPNSQDQSDGFNKSNTQNMYMTSNSKSGNQRESRIGGGSRMGNVSPTNSSKVITYKVPQSDLNKLKSLEKIYLQRLEISTGNNPQSSSKKQKKGKQQTQNVSDYNNDFDSQSARSSHMNNFNGYYGADNRQVRDTSDIHAPSTLLMENPNSLVIADFGDDGSYKE